jgi:hypothetical protein
MSDAWKKHDRPCPPCPDCGAELYEKCWGNGGWAKTDKATDRSHHDSDCVKRLRDAIDDAWGIIANAQGGNWDQASPEWRQAAERWRDQHITRRSPPIDKKVSA